MKINNLNGIGDPDGFHGWAERQSALSMIATGGAFPFNTSLLNQSCPESCPNPSAPVPIARIIDSKDADIGTLALTPGISLGIAEYSSANFYSDDTINSPNFLSPLPSQVEVHEPELDATGQTLRRYVYFRAGFGEQNYPLALASALAPYVIDPLATPTEGGLDDKVFQGYGAKLFPRAIGYSAGLVDYFFRGRITTDHFGTFSAIPFEQRPASIQVSNLNVSDSTSNEQAGPGNVQLVLMKTAVGALNIPPIADTFPDVLISNPASLSGTTLTFSFDSLPFPLVIFPEDCLNCAAWTEYRALLVFKGTLGHETENAVIVGGEYCGSFINHLRFYHTSKPNFADGDKAAMLGLCGFSP
jgi:hypothetical protein